MRKRLFYHIYLRWDIDSWLDIFFEQMKCMEDAGLLNEFSSVNFTAINRRDNTLGKKYLLDAIYSYLPKNKVYVHFEENPFYTDEEMMANLDNPRLVTENSTFRRMYNDATYSVSDELICYIHTKGITRTVKYNSLDIESIKRYYYWRQYLNWGVLSNWRACTHKLQYENFDVAGINYTDSPSPHFSGNFWWARTDYLKKLPNPARTDWWHQLQQNSTNMWLKNIASDRYRDEQWVCFLKDAKIYNVANLLHFDNPAFKLLRASEYGDINP